MSSDIVQELISELRAQGDRHAAEIKGLASKVEKNTEVVQKCMMDLVEFNAERSNLTRCLIDMREQGVIIRDTISTVNIEIAILNTRWAMTKIMVGFNFTAIGVFIAWLKLF